jgi:hypothetical protein
LVSVFIDVERTKEFIAWSSARLFLRSTAARGAGASSLWGEVCPEKLREAL